MTWEIVRLAHPEARGTLAREAYEGRRPDGSVLWSVELDLGDMSASGFREEVVWTDAGVVAVGGKGVVLLLDPASGAVLRRIEVPSYFGHLSVERVDGAEWLFVLGWEDVHAFAPNRQEQWVSRGLAVDGITGGRVEGAILHVSAEMDPPGGWFDVQLDVRTGRELTREPVFAEGDVGLHGAEKPDGA